MRDVTIKSALLALVLVAIPASGATPKKPTATAKATNRLDQMIEATRLPNGQPLIESYRIESGSAYLQLNPSVWNRMSSGEQRQVCDMLAGVDVWQAMGLVNAWLFVYRTNIGRIKPRFTGGFEFKPAE